MVSALYVSGQCPNVVVTSPNTEYCISDFIELRASNVPTSSIVEWNLGNGWDTTSDLHFGAAALPGALAVDLRLTLSDGTICPYSFTDVTTVHALPKADLNISRNLICSVSDTITLTDLTPTSVRRNWVVNNLTFENTERSKVLVISDPGNYTITLVAQDNNGCINSKTGGQSINAYSNIGLDYHKSNTDHCYPVTTDFTSTYTLGNQSIKSYSWKLPGSDNASPTSEDVKEVTYSSIGVFNTELTIVTDQGCTYTESKISDMRLGDTVKLGLSVDKTTACLSEKIQLVQTENPVPGVFYWTINSATLDRPDKYKANVTFKDTGSYDLTLIHDHNKCISTLERKDLIHIEGLKADFSSTNAFHCESPHKVDLVNESDTSSKISAFYWRIIDAETGTELTKSSKKDLSVTISKSPSRYHVELITVAQSGCSDTTVKQNFIEVRPYAFDFFAEPDIGCVGQDFSFVNKTPSGSYYGLDLFSWDFYNKDKSKVLGSSGSLNPVFSYNDTGYYHVQLTAANPLGCQEKYMAENAVRVVKPVLDYNTEDSIVCLNDSLRLITRSVPADEQFTNTYRFKHLATGTTHTVSGDTVTTGFSEIGEYEVTYWYTVNGGCNDSITNSLWVNGLKGKIELDTQSGCSPLTVHPSFSIDYNVHVGFTDTTLSYYWDVVPRSGAAVQGATTANPVIRLTENREYRIALYVTNSSGCVNYIVSDPVQNGLNSILHAYPTTGCIGDTIILTDGSTNSPTHIKWEVDRSSGYQLDSINETKRRLILKDTGSLIVSLIASKDGACLDTATRHIQAVKLTADFDVTDSVFTCAPATVTFINKSENADSLQWLFGDGSNVSFPNQDTIKHSYQVNSDKDGFDITLIAKTSFGCADTITRQNRVRLNGPVADFQMSVDKGCEPLKISFTNNSQNYTSFYFSYGDTLRKDTNTLSDYTYSNTDTTLRQLYYPQMRVVDATGCEATYRPASGIEVYNNPEIGLEVLPDTLVCQREIFTVKDTGIYSTYWIWSLNGSHVAYTRSTELSVNQEGKNALQLIAKNNYNCSDTINAAVWASKSAEIEFLMPDFLCEQTPITLNLETDDDVNPVLYRWDFGDPGNGQNNQTTIDPTASITYSASGKYTIRVVAELANGCAIPDSVEIEVFDSKNTPVVELDYASFNVDNKVVLKYKDFSFDYFDFFNIYREGNFIAKADASSSLELIDPASDKTNRNCYSLSVSNKCGVEGDKGGIHCPIILSVASTLPEQVNLDWTYYVGWERVEYYEIYRKEKDSSDYVKVGEVFSTQRSFTDSLNLCNRLYDYRVAAVREDDVRTYSNREEIEPQFRFNLNELDVANVSVLLDQSVHIRWFPSSYEENSHYRVNSYAGDFGSPLGEVDVYDTFYVDQTVDPSVTSILYTVTEVDQCDNASKPGNFGKTILLTTAYDDGISYLDWKPYEHWDHPIANHHIEFVRYQTILHVDQVGSGVFEYEDPTLYRDVEGFYPFRVYATNTNGDTSYSNISRTSGEAVFIIPNSFSPNNDGINDRFNFFTLFVVKNNQISGDDYQIDVYNRWGEHVFFTNDIHALWDGTSLTGEVLPSGVYMYRIQFTEGSGKRIYSSGTVHLMR